MSLSKLARAADINRQGMEKWKDPEVEPTLESMRRLAAALDVPLSRLTGAGKNAYASLQQWLEAHPDTDDDLADWLWSQSFRFGDPGPSTWDLLSATYRTARSQAEGREHAPSSPKRR